MCPSPELEGPSESSYQYVSDLDTPYSVGTCYGDAYLNGINRYSLPARSVQIMRRRNLLGLAATAGVAGGLGFAATRVDSPAAPPATTAAERVPPAGERNGPVVARDAITVGNERYGTVRQLAKIVDIEPTGRYVLVATYRLIPGSNYNASTKWKSTSLTVEHTWEAGTLVSYRGDVVPADDATTGSTLYLATDRSSDGYRWHLTFDSPTGNSHTYRFATIIDRAETATRGDRLAEATVGAGFTKGFLGASERDVATARLAIQDVD